MQENPDCSGVAQDALVLGPSGHVKPDPTVPAQPAQSTDSTIHSDSTQGCVKPRSQCLALEPQLSRSKGSLRWWQHKLRLLISV